jgi:hypothetical protein
VVARHQNGVVSPSSSSVAAKRQHTLHGVVAGEAVASLLILGLFLGPYETRGSPYRRDPALGVGTGHSQLNYSSTGNGIPSCQRAQVEDRRKTSSVRLIHPVSDPGRTRPGREIARSS